MMKPGKTKPGKATKERAQGKPPGESGVNKPVKQAKVPQVKPGVTYGKPTQKQAL
jgi:hypothetical protein